MEFIKLRLLMRMAGNTLKKKIACKKEKNA
jgi:hypothetical protein